MQNPNDGKDSFKPHLREFDRLMMMKGKNGDDEENSHSIQDSSVSLRSRKRILKQDSATHQIPSQIRHVDQANQEAHDILQQIMTLLQSQDPSSSDQLTQLVSRLDYHYTNLAIGTVIITSNFLPQLIETFLTSSNNDILKNILKIFAIIMKPKQSHMESFTTQHIIAKLLEFGLFSSPLVKEAWDCLEMIASSSKEASEFLEQMGFTQCIMTVLSSAFECRISIESPLTFPLFSFGDFEPLLVTCLDTLKFYLSDQSLETIDSELYSILVHYLVSANEHIFSNAVYCCFLLSKGTSQFHNFITSAALFSSTPTPVPTLPLLFSRCSEYLPMYIEMYDTFALVGVLSNRRITIMTLQGETTVTSTTEEKEVYQTVLDTIEVRGTALKSILSIFSDITRFGADLPTLLSLHVIPLLGHIAGSLVKYYRSDPTARGLEIEHSLRTARSQGQPHHFSSLLHLYRNDDDNSNIPLVELATPSSDYVTCCRSFDRSITQLLSYVVNTFSNIAGDADEHAALLFTDAFPNEDPTTILEFLLSCLRMNSFTLHQHVFFMLRNLVCGTEEVKILLINFEIIPKIMTVLNPRTKSLDLDYHRTIVEVFTVLLDYSNKCCLAKIAEMPNGVATLEQHWKETNPVLAQIASSGGINYIFSLVDDLEPSSKTRKRAYTLQKNLELACGWDFASEMIDFGEDMELSGPDNDFLTHLPGTEFPW